MKFRALTLCTASRRFRTAAACLLLAWPGAPAMPQDAMSPEAEKSRQLITRIKRSMSEIDTLLLGGVKPQEASEASQKVAEDIENLLDETSSKSRLVSDSIDELIKMAKYQKSQNPQGGGDGNSSDPSSSPRREKSQDPSDLVQQGEPRPDQDQPDPQQQEQPQRRDGDPKGNKESEGDPRQRNAEQNPPEGETAMFESDVEKQRWGLLPPKEAEDLQRHRVEDLPQRYRIWMEMYYRRVNSSRPRR